MSALGSWLMAQVLKFFITWITNGRPDFRRLFGDGGMPSGHTVTVICAAVMVGYTCGFASPLFGIAFIFSIVVMHDATGVRRETGKQSRALNIIVEELFKSNDIKALDTHFKELIGHTPLQVVFGFITGVAAAIALSFIPAFGVSLL